MLNDAPEIIFFIGAGFSKIAKEKFENQLFARRSGGNCSAAFF